jgi:hypothetical protein
LLVVTVVAALRAQPLRVDARELPFAAAAVAGWALLWVIAPDDLDGWSNGAVAAVLALAAFVAAAVAAGGSRVAVHHGH